jgi:hypothetical protein
LIDDDEQVQDKMPGGERILGSNGQDFGKGLLIKSLVNGTADQWHGAILHGRGGHQLHVRQVAIQDRSEEGVAIGLQQLAEVGGGGRAVCRRDSGGDCKVTQHRRLKLLALGLTEGVEVQASLLVREECQVAVCQVGGRLVEDAGVQPPIGCAKGSYQTCDLLGHRSTDLASYARGELQCGGSVRVKRLAA